MKQFMDTNVERHVFCSHLTAAQCLKAPICIVILI
jgi:hypothetical protein